ncbi:HNH endonuclease [Salegentibacter sp. UBA1130]|uniref:HNH endonuclease n=1 Tax=Salegentibacter sp. UBA1130 TaxID=1947451 RepID=UPI00257C102F|nr:HNH endonuclease [Salegentibacter sp. UBA1130]
MTGKSLSNLLKIEAFHALYRKDGKWYHNLKKFPGVLFDLKGYIIFKTKEDYITNPYLKITKDLHIKNGISSLAGYQYFTPHQIELINKTSFKENKLSPPKKIVESDAVSTEDFDKYFSYFRKLKRGVSGHLGKAPHKPVLLLAVIRGIRRNQIQNKRIFITPELILNFRETWNQLVDTGHTENFALPFFHMRSEPFWQLVAKPGMEIGITRSGSIRSFKNLQETVAFAQIDPELFLLLQQSHISEFLESHLLQQFFNTSQTNYRKDQDSAEESQLEYQIQHSSGKEYRERLFFLKSQLDESQYQEELFIRGGLFKRSIPKIYDQRCCISGMRIMGPPNIQMIDACHIHPFSISNDDTVTNGIALSPTLHRAFDRGLISITPDYEVKVSGLVNDKDSEFTLSQFQNKPILLPNKESWFPSTESLSWHLKNIFIE